MRPYRPGWLTETDTPTFCAEAATLAAARATAMQMDFMRELLGSSSH
jgi:hypothetical protein